MLRPIDLNEEQSWLATASLIVIAAVAGAVALAYTRPVMVPLVLAVLIFHLVARSPLRSSWSRRSWAVWDC
jgi:predicted PurR-regulated permease PerM